MFESSGGDMSDNDERRTDQGRRGFIRGLTGLAGDGNRAWKVAMQVRNARNCALITHQGVRDMDDEAERQRRIAGEFA